MTKPTKGDTGMHTFKRIGIGAVASSAALALCLSTPIAGASVSHKKLSPVQIGKKFYAGKTISFISPGSVGGLFDLIARDLAPYLATYLHSTVNVTDIPAGATIPGQNFTEAATPDGLTIGELNSVGDAANVLTGTPGINFNPGRVAYIASYAPTPLVLLATPASGLTSFSQLQNAVTPIKGLTLTTGTGPTISRSLMGVLHLKINWITGYQNQNAQITGLLRGDGQFAWVTLQAGGPLIQSGQVRLLAITSRAPKGMAYESLIKSAPTTAEILKQYPAKSRADKKGYAAVTLINQMASVLPIFTQTGVPAARVEALRAATKWAFKQSALQTQLLNQGINDQYRDPVAAKLLYINALKESGVLVPYILGQA